jgi:hypothetical protein
MEKSIGAWGSENPNDVAEYEHDSPKTNVCGEL